ncbi:hypothetical protein C0J52_14302 [Blattella germanica]|nr:hypothetical protein C0J52_14302 [Blattella germanica]
MGLTPKCEDLLVRCKWLGRHWNCSDLFKLRKTMEGYCCSFNYIRETDEFYTGNSNVKVNVSLGWKVRSPGYHMGLTVLVDPQPEDYYYPLISSYGTKILVFNPRDFPDTPSGGLIEKLVPPRSEVFFRLEATTVYAVPNVQSFDWKQRGCVFPSEGSALLGSYYSYRTTKQCDFSDIPCLFKYREKWSTLRPTENIPGLAAEMEDSISCEDCYPSCSDTSYHVQTAAAELSQNPYDYSGNFGGICGLFVGFSLISVVEFVYFFTLRLFFVMKEPQNTKLKKETSVSNQTNQNIYWREVMPRQAISRY